MSGSLEFAMSSVNFNSKPIEMNVKEEINSKEDELGIKFIPSIQSTSIYHLVPKVEIKPEETNFHHNHNSKADPNSENQFDVEPVIVFSIPRTDSVSVKAEQENDLNELSADLLLCQQDCETCQKYMKILSEHVRATHFPTQPTQDPLQIVPLNIDPDHSHDEQLSSLSIQIKCEIDESIDKVDYSDDSEEDSRLNSESDTDFDPESEGESDSNSSLSNHLTRNIRRRDSAKIQASSASKRSNAKKSILSSRKQFKCNECDKTYSSRGNLYTHRRVHTRETHYKCDQCEKSFSRKGSLSRHKILHTGEKLHTCDVCGKSFSRLSHLTRHQRRHPEGKGILSSMEELKCNECNKSFSSKGNLNKHRIIHRGEKPHKCDQCHKTYSTKGHLKEHTRIHTGETPYQCDVCEKSFTSSYQLARHKRTHTGKRPHE